MKQRLLAILLAICLLVGLLPVAAMAAKTGETEYTKTHGAEDDMQTDGTDTPLRYVSPLRAGTEVSDYDGLTTAINNAAEGVETVITMAEGTEIALESTVMIPANKVITLCGTGTLRPAEGLAAAGSETALLSVAEGGKLTIDGLTIDGGSSATGAATPVLVYCAGELLLKNGTLTGAHIRAVTNSAVTNSGAVVIQGTTAHFTMAGGSIEGNTIDCVSRCGSVFLAVGAAFDMTGGTIQDNACKQADYSTEPATAGVMVVSELSGTPANTSTTFHLSGGFIQNNTTTGSSRSAGGGVCLWGPDWGSWSRYARMTMEGGTIQNNTTVYGGGGVFVSGAASFNMSGGEILNNTVTNGVGGGVCVYDGVYGEVKSLLNANGLTWEDYAPGYGSTEIDVLFNLANTMGMIPSTLQTPEQLNDYGLGSFTLNGGTISGNEACMDQQVGDNGCGGGVYIATMNAELVRGTISNNIGERQGGGIYVGSTPYVLNMKNAVITGNTASILGGGLWFCPTGDVTSVVTNGSAIYDNTATPANNSAGDDIAIVPQGDTHFADLSVRMLGGGQVTWYRDGGVDGKSVLGMPDLTTYPRYEAGVHEEVVATIQGKQEGIAIKCVASQAVKDLAESQATLWVTGNSSQRGGGIGSNGGIIIGVPDQEYTLTVTKDWGTTPTDQQTEVTINLKIGNYVLDGVKLNAGNNWTASFSGLPDPASLTNADITVEEEKLNGFTTSYTEPTIDTTHKTIRITVTNTPEVLPGALQVQKIVSGSASSTSKVWHFTVTLDDTSITGTYGDMTFENGVAVFTLQHGQTKTANNLPAGIHYTVTEAEENQDGYTTTKTGNSGTILTNETVSAIFTNTKSGSTPPPPSGGDKPGNLTILKTVTGDGDQHRGFTFTITITAADGKPLATSFSYSGSQTGTIRSGETVILCHGESITITGIPAGSLYTVTETPEDGYTVEATGASGTISANQTVTAAFVNDLQEPDIPEEPEEPDEPEVPEQEPEQPDDERVPDDVPQTNDISLYGVWAIAALCCALGLRIVQFVKRRTTNHYRK